MLHSGTMSLLGSILEQHQLTTIVDIGITALLIYWLFSLIRGTRAVRLVIGVSVLVVVYGLAIAFDLRLLTQILQGGAVVGLFALVVIFQPELRRPAGVRRSITSPKTACPPQATGGRSEARVRNSRLESSGVAEDHI